LNTSTSDEANAKQVIRAAGGAYSSTESTLDDVEIESTNELRQIKKKESKISDEEQEQINQIAEEEFATKYDSTVIYSLFFLIFFSNILINVDHGTLPGSTKEIEKKLNIGDFQFGMLGSVVYGGLTLGSAVATMLFTNGDKIKPAIAGSLLCNAICLLVFTRSHDFLLSCALRFCIGFF
jgi:sugar phosphate permease